MFTEKVQDFLQRKPDVTMLGFAWAVTWRMQLAILLAYVVGLLALLIIGGLIGLD